MSAQRASPLLPEDEAVKARAWVRTASRSEYEALKRALLQASAKDDAHRRGERELAAIQARHAALKPGAMQ